MTNNNDEFVFTSSSDAQQAAIYSSNQLEVEAANQYLMNAERSADRLDIANKARLELGRYSTSLRDARGMDAIIANLHELAEQYAWSFKPKEVIVLLRTWRYLRQLKY